MTSYTNAQTLMGCLVALTELGEADFIRGDEFTRDLQIIGSSAALLDSGSKKRLGMLAIVGDALVNLVVSDVCLSNGATSQQCQELKARACSDATLGRLFVDTGMSRYVAFVAGVPVSGKPGATALEAMVGFVYVHTGDRRLTAVRTMLINLGAVVVTAGSG